MSIQTSIGGSISSARLEARTQLFFFYCLGKNTEFKPNFYVKLKLKEGENEAFVDFNADYGNLKNMTEELERVSDYMKSISYRKLVGPFKKMK